MTPEVLCAAVVDYDETEGCDLTCGEEAVFMCCDEPRCDQCAHDWLDELEAGHEHTIRVIAPTPTTTLAASTDGDSHDEG